MAQRRRTGYRIRKSLSDPVTVGGEAAVGPEPKRLKLWNDENCPISPFEELINRKGDKDETGTTKYSTTSLTPAVKKLFVKSPSDSFLTSCKVKTAVEKIENDPDLIGDASKSYILPVIEDGKLRDLKEITPETLANLVQSTDDGDGHQKIAFKIVDCRYPYEFDGGHIRGALNLYTKGQVKDELLTSKALLSPPTTKHNSAQEIVREILVFHCEFSSQRGPSLCRYLRNTDRDINSSSYPALFYPELYILSGGYKDFFEKCPHLCEPAAYVPMAHPEFTEKYRKFKSETKLNR